MFEALTAGIDEVLDLDCDRLTGVALSDAVVELERLRSRLEAAVARVEHAWDSRGCWQADNARSGTAWLKWRCHLPGAVAAQRLRLAHTQHAMPIAAKRWQDGDIGGAHLDRLGKAATPATAQAMARDEKLLTDHAAKLRYDQFTRTLAYWTQYADPDGADRHAERVHDSRAFHLSQTFDGVHIGDLRLDPIGGAAFTNVLTAIADELYRQDQSAGIERTRAQRRADALVEMAVRAATPNKAGQRPAPLFTVFVGYETFAGRICELDDGTAIAPGSLRAWLTAADIERVVFDTPSRVIDVGERRRLFTGATRRALEVRDRQCQHPTCDLPLRYLQADHLLPYTDGGPTLQTNGAMKCGHHNRNRDDLTPPSPPQDDPP